MTDFSKIGKSNRSRGNSYERKIAKFLSNVTGVNFKRSPRSGALLRQGAFDGNYIGGDLSCEKSLKYSLECKNCAGMSIFKLIKSPTTTDLIGYWAQCVYDARISNKLPMLIFHVSSVRKDFVCFDNDGLKLLDTNNILSINIGPFIDPVTINIDNKKQSVNVPNMTIMMMDVLEQLFKNNNLIFN